MKKLNLNDLLGKGDVIRVDDATDSDYGRLFVCRGRASGHNVMDEAGGDMNAVAVERLPEYEKLFQFKHWVPEPENRFPSTEYRAVLEDLSKNSKHLASAMKLGLAPSFDYNKAVYQRKDSAKAEAELRETGKARLFDIVKSGLSFRQGVPKDSLFSGVAYELSSLGVWITADISFSNLDRAFGLGYKDKSYRYDTGKMKERQMQQPVYDRERLGQVFEELKSKGVLVREIGGCLPDITWHDGPDFPQIFSHLLLAEILSAPVEDIPRARTLHFESLETAHQYMQGLFEKTPPLAKDPHPVDHLGGK